MQWVEEGYVEVEARTSDEALEKANNGSLPDKHWPSRRSANQHPTAAHPHGNVATLIETLAAWLTDAVDWVRDSEPFDVVADAAIFLLVANFLLGIIGLNVAVAAALTIPCVAAVVVAILLTQRGGRRFGSPATARSVKAVSAEKE
jgi:hypothetical protein